MLIEALLVWYDRHRRTLPWRVLPGEPTDPYRVWLSEIMLQQTTVTAVIPYFTRFTDRFPTLAALAAAPEHDVMQAWAGLGYYARARNLHRCAQLAQAAGGLPATPEALRALPGIGAYTATAIAAIAHNHPGIPIDGNVDRVFARLNAVTTPFPAAKPEIVRAAAELAAQPAARSRPSDTAQALFDLGATLCTPAAPACALCPWRDPCAARARSLQSEIPRKQPKPPRPIRHGAHFYLTTPNGAVMLRRRPPKGLLGGMTELPGTEWRDTAWPQAEALTQVPQPADWRPAGQVRHVFTHFELRLDVYAATVPAILHPGAADPASAAFPSLMRKCLALARASLAQDCSCPRP